MPISLSHVEVQSRPGTLLSYRSTMERVILRIRQRLEEELSLGEMADIAAMSPFHFHRVFHRLTGLPPGQFLSALRLEKAKRLLLTEDRCVTDICFEVGYKSLGTFTSRFTQLVGLPPTQFRLLGRTFCIEGLDELPGRLAQSPEGPGGREIAGEIETGVGGLLFIGLFDRALPQGRPLACTLASRPGTYRLRAPADGRYFVFAADLSWPADPIDYLLYHRSVLGVSRAGPLSVRGERLRGDASLRLRLPDLLDPPLLLTLPLLIRQQFGPPADEIGPPIAHKEQSRRSASPALGVV